jgi:hypothetical protein
MKVVSIPRLSPLEQFAHWFHQDFFSQFSDVRVGAAVYLSQLSASERQYLNRALAAFLQKHAGKSEKGIRRAWINLGACAWPMRGSTRELLNSFLDEPVENRGGRHRPPRAK